jgi:hypothetical protein
MIKYIWEATIEFVGSFLAIPAIIDRPYDRDPNRMPTPEEMGGD